MPYRSFTCSRMPSKRINAPEKSDSCVGAIKDSKVSSSDGRVIARKMARESVYPDGTFDGASMETPAPNKTAQSLSICGIIFFMANVSQNELVFQT